MRVSPVTVWNRLMCLVYGHRPVHHIDKVVALDGKYEGYRVVRGHYSCSRCDHTQPNSSRSNPPWT